MYQMYCICQKFEWAIIQISASVPGLQRAWESHEEDSAVPDVVPEIIDPSYWKHFKNNFRINKKNNHVDCAGNTT